MNLSSKYISSKSIYDIHVLIKGLQIKTINTFINPIIIDFIIFKYTLIFITNTIPKIIQKYYNFIKINIISNLFI